MKVKPDTHPSNSPERLKEIADQAREIALKYAGGNSEAEITVTTGEGLSVVVREQNCESVEFAQDNLAIITIYLDGRKGSATTTDFSTVSITESIKAAYSFAENGDSDEYQCLAEKRYCPNDPDSLNLEIDCPWNIDTNQAVALGAACESELLNFDRRIKQSDGISINSYRGTIAYANNHFLSAYRGTTNSISASAIASDTTSGMQKGYWYSVNRNPKLLQDPKIIGRKAAERATNKLGSKKIPTMECPILFEPRVAQTLIGHLINAISGSAQYRQSSFLLDSLGTKILPDFISLEEQPHLLGGQQSAPFDSDGVATSPKAIIKNGIVKTYLLDAYAAKKLKLKPTGNGGGTRNLILRAPKTPIQTVLEKIDSGLLITDLMGFGVNAVTGDYSRGASGFEIKGGEIVSPVEEITIAGNLKDMLKGIVAVGDDTDDSLNIQTGSLLLDNMAVAGS